MTITRKRQVTIPRAIWDKLELDGVRYLEADVMDNVLSLKKVDFSGRMEAFWQTTANSVKEPISDLSIRQASRKAHKNKSI